MASEPEYYRINRIRSTISSGVRDPHVPDINQYHHAIYVLHDTDRGVLHHTIGNVTDMGGMKYETKYPDLLDFSAALQDSQFLGYIHKDNYGLLAAALQALPTPHRQKAFNSVRMATEPFRKSNPLTFYTANELKNFEFPRLQKCKWWVEAQAMPKIQELQVLGIVIQQLSK